MAQELTAVAVGHEYIKRTILLPQWFGKTPTTLWFIAA